ncbi:MAG: class I SAM-dependent methyltransferase [Bacteroidales bacterium]|nr:class I SAM-dependent methyltransferase [Bacteroidales bacterium]
MNCRLCGSETNKSFAAIDGITLYKCDNCLLIFKAYDLELEPDSEKNRYLQHNNSEEDQAYLRHLNTAIQPTLPFLSSDMEGLDFGCGPNPVLAKVLTKSGYTCSFYDPFFFPDLPDERQDFVFATETFEHFSNPAKELQLITALLRPHGTLTIMTNRWDENTDLGKWWYVRDPTHLVFYHKETFRFISEKYDYSLEYDDGSKIVILRKLVCR